MPIWDQLANKAETLIKEQTARRDRPATPENQQSSVPSAPPPSAVQPTPSDDRWNFDKVKNALRGGSTHQEKKVEEAHAEIRRETEAKEKKGISGLFGKLQDVIDGGDEKRLMEELIKLEAEDKTLRELDQQLEANRDIGDKIKDKLTGGDPAYLKEKERIKVERERVRLAREKVQADLKLERDSDGRRNLLEKFQGKNDRIEEIRRREAEIKREKAEGNWLDKIKDKVGETEEEKQLRTEREALEAELKGSLSYQVRDLIGKAPQEPTKQPEKPLDVKGKLNEALGGGDKGEREEDRLDKAIDMFQQHVLKQGNQSNESAVEQQKDAAIAAGIRQALGAVKGPDARN